MEVEKVGKRAVNIVPAAYPVAMPLHDVILGDCRPGPF